MPALVCLTTTAADPTRAWGEMPDAGHFCDLLCNCTPSQARLHRILVSNPAKLYEFEG
jgi:hypothetical protein